MQFDHVGVAARDPQASAFSLAEILGAPTPIADGADGDMYRIDLDHGAFVLFHAAAQPEVVHVAFRVQPERFAEVVVRLRRRDLAFGNDPDDPRNGRTDDPLGGAGRVYFVDDNGHLFEVTC